MQRALTDWLTHYMQLTENSEPARLYREWVGVSVIASVLQRKCWSQWEKQLFPNFYIILVGPSGARKGTAMGQGYEFLRRPEMKVNLAAESITREALIRRLKKSETTITEGKPMAHSSLTIYSEEFAVFVGQNNLEMISAITDWFDCKSPWKYETKTQGEDTVNGIWVNILGATTPAIIKNVLPQDAIGGGLTSRILFVYAAGVAKLVTLPIRTTEEQELQEVLARDLEKISCISGEFRPTVEFIEAYVAWYENHHHNPPLSDEKFAGYNQRRPTHLRKLAMVMSASRGDDKQLTLSDFERAHDLLVRTERLMPKVFSGYGRLDTSTLIDSISAMIATRKAISEAELLRIYMKDITRDELTQTLAVLEEVGICDIKSAGPGQPKIVYYKQGDEDA